MTAQILLVEDETKVAKFIQSSSKDGKTDFAHARK